MDGKSWLNQVTVGELIEDIKEIYFVRSGDPLGVALDLLVAHKIQSIPVFYESNKRFESFLSLTDVLHYATQVMDETDLARGKTVGFVALVNADKKFQFAKCGDVANRMPGSIVVNVPMESKLLDCISTMVHSDFLVERMAVVERDDKVRGILSQSRIVRAVYANIEAMPFKKKTVAEVMSERDFAARKVIALPTTSTVAEALELLKRNSISAIGILDLDGRLVGNFSASDIKHFTEDLSAIIGTPLERFLDTVKKPEGLSYPVAVTTKATLEEVMAKFDMAGIHRVYVIDPARRPIGVLSTKDLLRIFLEAATGRRVELASPDDPNRMQRVDLVSGNEREELSESVPKPKRGLHSSGESSALSSSPSS